MINNSFYVCLGNTLSLIGSFRVHVKIEEFDSQGYFYISDNNCAFSYFKKSMLIDWLMLF